MGNGGSNSELRPFIDTWLLAEAHLSYLNRRLERFYWFYYFLFGK
jgi:hypothetical protein